MWSSIEDIVHNDQTTQNQIISSQFYVNEMRDRPYQMALYPNCILLFNEELTKQQKMKLNYLKCFWVQDGKFYGLRLIKFREQVSFYTENKEVYDIWKNKLRQIVLVSDFH